MTTANKIAVISGRYIFHNPYRELVLIDKLKEKGFDVSLFLPSVSHYPKGIAKTLSTIKYSRNTILLSSMMILIL